MLSRSLHTFSSCGGAIGTGTVSKSYSRFFQSSSSHSAVGGGGGGGRHCRRMVIVQQQPQCRPYHHHHHHHQICHYSSQLFQISKPKTSAMFIKQQHPKQQQLRQSSLRFSSSSTSSPPKPEEIASYITKLSQQPGGIEGFAQSLSPETRKEVSQHVLFLLGRQHTAAPLAAAEQQLLPEEPSFQDLKAIAVKTAIPFVGFGFMDNAILIIAGDAIDTSFGVLLGISTMCAAAIGNIVSDVAGIMLGTVIEDFVSKYLNLPTPDLTTAQRELRSVRWANQFGCAVGIVIGCIIGMAPLLFIDSNKIQALKREAHMDSIFRDVINEAKNLVSAQDTHLYLVVDDKETKQPSPNGKFLYAKYDVKNTHVDQFFPLGRGIISRAALTGEAWNIYDVRSEPDYVPELYVVSDTLRSMVCVPIMDAEGRTIAVLQAINKEQQQSSSSTSSSSSSPQSSSLLPRNPRIGFSSNDVQVLKALASHISVSLQRMYGDNGDDEEMRLSQTISMLKDYGLEGLTNAADAGQRKLLFPED